MRTAIKRAVILAHSFGLISARGVHRMFLGGMDGEMAEFFELERIVLP